MPLRYSSSCSHSLIAPSLSDLNFLPFEEPSCSFGAAATDLIVLVSNQCKKGRLCVIHSIVVVSSTYNILPSWAIISKTALPTPPTTTPQTVNPGISPHALSYVLKIDAIIIHQKLLTRQFYSFSPPPYEKAPVHFLSPYVCFLVVNVCGMFCSKCCRRG